MFKNSLVQGSSPSLRTLFLNQPAYTKAGFLCSRVTHLKPKQTGARTFRKPLAKGLEKLGSTAQVPVHHRLYYPSEFRRRNSASQQRVSGRTQSQSAYFITR